MAVPVYGLSAVMDCCAASLVLGNNSRVEKGEHKHRLEFLRREGCTLGQGYLTSRAVSAEDLAAFMRQTT